MENVKKNQKLNAEYWIRKMDMPHACILSQEEITKLNEEIYYVCAQEGCMFDITQMEGAYGFGICVKRSNIRRTPEEYEHCGESEAGQLAAIIVNEPVAVLKVTEDGKWYYIYTFYYGGWVKSCDIALCKSYEEWESERKIHNPLIVTASRMRLECNPDKALSQLELSMGTVLDMDTEVDIDDIISGKNVCCNYVVRIPVREENGLLCYKKAKIPVSAEVNIGYLKYTPENILRQAFKTLGEIYGWGGWFNSRDCSSLVSDVFSCFGIKLPRDTSGLSRLRGENIYIGIDGLSAEEKKKLLSGVRQGVVLGFPGHVMIYSGQEDDNFYCINQVGHFCMESDGKLKVYQVDSCVVNDLEVRRKNGKTWLESLSYILPLG